MRTADAALGRGVGKALLDHLVAVARAEGMTRLSLETGATHSSLRPAGSMSGRVSSAAARSAAMPTRPSPASTRKEI